MLDITILLWGQLHALEEKERACQAAYDANEVCSDICHELWHNVVTRAMGTDALYMTSVYDVGHVMLEAYFWVGGMHHMTNPIYRSLVYGYFASPPCISFG